MWDCVLDFSNARGLELRVAIAIVATVANVDIVTTVIIITMDKTILTIVLIVMKVWA